MEKITHNNLPEAVERILDELEHLKRIVSAGFILEKEGEYKPHMSKKEAAAYIGTSVSSLEHNKTIPKKIILGRVTYMKADLDRFIENVSVKNHNASTLLMPITRGRKRVRI